MCGIAGIADSYQRLPGVIQAGIPRLVSMLATPFSGSLRYRLNRISNVCDAAGSEFVPRLVNKLAYIQPSLIRKLLGGNAVVTRDVAENSVVAGVPAKLIRTLSPGALDVEGGTLSDE